MLDRKAAWTLVEESNAIEGILRRPTEAEVDEFLRFVALDVVTPIELVRFVHVFQPGAVLRNRPGMNVYIGDHRPIMGGPMVEEELKLLLTEINQGKLEPFEAHCEYEHLHPFTDGNGRSGRALWAQMMVKAGKEGWCQLPLGFLHWFYYGALSRFHGTYRRASKDSGEA